MELPVSDKVASFEKKPRIKKGYYGAKLLECKIRAKEDGTPIEGKFGKQLILLFSIYDQERKNTISVPIGDDKRKTKDLVLPMILNVTYKDEKTGGERTAITPNARITKVFEALGWTLDAKKKLNTDDFIGRWIEANVDDYDAKFKGPDGKEEVYKASCIKDVGKLEEEGATPSPSEIVQVKTQAQAEKNIVVEEEIKHEDVFPPVKELSKEEKAFEYKKELLVEMNVEGKLTDEGLAMALEQINKELQKMKRG